MRETAGVVGIVLLWLMSADYIRDFPFEVKLPSFVLMGLATLGIAYFSRLIDLKSCKKLQ